jgi:hypothetical protein
MLQQSPPAYVSPLHTVERVRIRTRRHRTRPDFIVMYAVAAVGGMASGLLLSVLA